MASAIADTPRAAQVQGSGPHATLRRVPVLDWSPACGFQMAAQYFTQAAYILELAKEAGEKISPQEALEAAAVQLSCQLELNPECMSRVRVAIREAERALDRQ